MTNLRDIAIFSNAITIEEINIESRCKNKFKVVTDNQAFFVKIEDNAYSEKDIEKVKWLYQTYKEEGIPTIPLIDIFAVNNETIWIFPFFEGKTLIDANVPLEQMKYYGEVVANDIKKLNKKNPDFNLFSILDLRQHCEDRVNKINNFLNCKDTRDKFLKVFNKIEWQELLNYYYNLYENIKNDDVMLNHNDIKLPNIMIDKSSNYYFIDLDPFDLTIIGYNIGYSISCFLFKDEKEREKAFLRAFIQTIDSSKSLISQMNYFLISDFINKIEMYFEFYQNNSSFIKSMLFNVGNILETELYKKTHN